MSNSNRTFAGGALLLIAATVVAYIPAFRAGYIWDDDTYVLNNESLRSSAGLERIWFEPGATPQFYPMVYTSYWIEYHLWGTRPAGYHAVNVLLHGVNAVLVWLLLRRLGLRWAWFAAAVFALHPVHVQSVAWIAERKNTLSGLFYLLSMLAYLRFDPLVARTAGQAADRRRWYVLALLAFLAAMLCKTVVCSLPAAILVLIWWKRGLAWRDLLRLLPFFAIGLALSAVTLIVEAEGVRLVASGWTFSPLDRVLLAGRALWFYAGKLLWPVELIHVYPRWTIDAGQWWQYLYPIAALAVVLTLWSLRRRIGKGPLAAVLFFGGSLLPMLGFVGFGYQQYSFVADHFQYLPSLAIIVLVVAIAEAAARNSGPNAVLFAPVVGVIYLLGLGIGVLCQSSIYRDVETLWRDTVAKDPESWVGNFSLGSVLAQTERPVEAIPYLEAALALEPDDMVTSNNLANAYKRAGRREDAQRTYVEALRRDPDNAFAHYNLGLMYVQQMQLDDALEHFAQALGSNPALEPAASSLARTLSHRVRELLAAGQPDDAEMLIRRTAKLAGDLDPRLLANLADAFAQAGESARALAFARQAREIATRHGNQALVDALNERIGRYETDTP